MSVERPTVAIIGAGPYGVSVAAHLRAHGANVRIFGRPMHRWRAQMPKGMFLKSEGCASSLAAPTGSYTLKEFCIEAGLAYGDYGVPVPLETFTNYALSFQRRFVPNVDDVDVTALEQLRDGFKLWLSTREEVEANKVVIATGLYHAAHVPGELAHLPSALLSHSADHHDLASLKGRDITIVGAGQSALEIAALLHEQHDAVRLIVRRAALDWNPLPDLGKRSPWQRLRYPMSKLGAGWQVWFYAGYPMLFYYLPELVRIDRVRRVLGPAGAWWLRGRVSGRVPVLLGHTVLGADARGDKAILHVRRPDGQVDKMTTDHVIAATGYRFSLRSLAFISPALLSSLRSVQGCPLLSPQFESSIPGLYFTGQAAAYQFGPAMRFVHGAGYAARRIAGHIAYERSRDRPSVSVVVPRSARGERALSR